MAQIFDRSSNALARMSPVRLHISFGILPYLAGPAARVLCARLNFHPLVQTNVPRLTKTLEPEHAHA